MTESERDPNIEWIARVARRPVELSPGARARLMDAVRATPRPRRVLGWLTAPRPLTLSPLASSLLAAGLVGVGVLAGFAVTQRDGRAPAGQPAAVAAQAQALDHDSLQVHRFELTAPGAVGVSLVGDFNGWNASATPMIRTPDGKGWTVTVQLPAGRHVYAFVVDGAGGTSKWMADPAALRAPDDGFGTPNSVVLVGQRGSST